MAKSARDARLVSDVKNGMTITAAGRKYGISRQRVSQICRSLGLDLSGRPLERWTKMRDRIVPHLGKEFDYKIAERYGVGLATVIRVRQEQHIGRFLKPIGCPRCSDNPYARGLCRNCYLAYLRRRVVNG